MKIKQKLLTLAVITVSSLLTGAVGYAFSKTSVPSKGVAPSGQAESHPSKSHHVEKIAGLTVKRTMGNIISIEGIDDLIAKSDIIAIGKPSASVEETKSLIQRDFEGYVSAAISEVEFKIDKVFKGDVNAKSIKVGQQAAVVTEQNRKFIQVFDEYQPMEKDKKYLLFLKKGVPGTPGAGLYFPVGVMYGKYNVDGLDKQEEKFDDVKFKAIKKIASERFKE